MTKPRAGARTSNSKRPVPREAKDLPVLGPSTRVPGYIRSSIPPPKGWADDELSTFLQRARENTYAVFANNPQVYAKVREIDDCFFKISNNLNETKSFVPAILLFRCHAAFRAGAMCALSGFGPETFPNLRLSIEAAAYALHIDTHDDLAEVWLRRHDSEDALQSVRTKFSNGKVKKTVVSKAPKLAAVYELLYERAVDFGAHMNERAATGSMKLVEEPGRKKYEMLYLLDDGPALGHVLKSLCQAGVLGLALFDVVFSERFMLLGLTDRVRALKQGL